MELSLSNKWVIVAYEKGYRVNNQGDVISPFSGLRRKLTHTSKFKYYRFNIGNLGKKYSVFVHKLVAYQKYGDELFGDGVVVRHKNNNSLDNSYDNILIGTQTDNMQDRDPKERLYHSIKASTHLRKFSDETIQEIKDRRGNGATYKELMEGFGITSKGSLHYMIHTDYVTKK